MQKLRQPADFRTEAEEYHWVLPRVSFFGVADVYGPISSFYEFQTLFKRFCPIRFVVPP